MKHVSPTAVAVAAALGGVGSALGGIYMLAGAGWTLLAAAVPLLALSAITFRGLMRGESQQ